MKDKNALQSMLASRKKLFEREKTSIKKKIVAIEKKLQALSATSPMFAKLTEEKMQLQAQLNQDPSNPEIDRVYKVLEDVYKKFDKLKTSEEKKKKSKKKKKPKHTNSGDFDFQSDGDQPAKDPWYKSRYDPLAGVKRGISGAWRDFKSIPSNIKNAAIDKLTSARDSLPYWLLEKSIRTAYSTTKFATKTAISLPFWMTGNRSPISFRKSKNVNNNELNKYRDQDIDLDKAEKTASLYSSSEQDTDAQQLIDQLKLQGVENLQILQILGSLIDQGKLQVAVGSPITTGQPSEDQDFSDQPIDYTNVRNQNQAIFVDQQNKKVLEDTLLEFYDHIYNKKQKDKKKGKFLQSLKSLFSVLKKAGVLVGAGLAAIAPYALGAAVVGAIGYLGYKLFGVIKEKLGFGSDQADYPQLDPDTQDLVDSVTDPQYSRAPGHGGRDYSKKFEVDNVDASSLGQLSANYEGKAGTVSKGSSWGDKGGNSFGKYQFSSKTGGLDTFMTELKKNHPEMYNQLTANGGEYYKDKDANKQFEENWKQLAKDNPEFAKAQDEVAKKQWYDPAARSLQKNTGIDLNDRSLAVKNAVWSSAIQHGSGRVSDLFISAGITEDMNDQEIVRRLYAERDRRYGALHGGNLSARYNREKQDAYAMLDQEKNAGQQIAVAQQDPVVERVIATVEADKISVNNPDIVQVEQKRLQQNPPTTMNMSANEKRVLASVLKPPAAISIPSHLGGAGLDLLNSGARV